MFSSIKIVCSFADVNCRYNQQSHPLPFIKASNVAAPKKAGKEKPDLEEALEESEDEEVLAEIQAEEDEEDLDLTKDKYVKQPKKLSLIHI